MTSNLQKPTSGSSRRSDSHNTKDLPIYFSAKPTVSSQQASSTQHCPHCRTASISLTKKMLFGPMFKFTCAQCGGRWRVSWWSVGTSLLAIAGTPVFVAIAWGTGLMKPSVDSLLGTALAAFGIAVYVIAKFVPVRKAN